MLNEKKIKDVQRFHDQDAIRYINDRYSGNSCEHLSYLTRKSIVLSYLKNSCGSILDVGCGPAIFTKELNSLGLKPHSIDLSIEMLKKARSLTNTAIQSYWVNCEVERLPFKDEAFDNVISIGVIAYATDTSCALNELVRVLKTGGLLVIQCSNSFAPTPFFQSLKDKVVFSIGLRQKEWDIKLTTHPFYHFKKLLKKSGTQIEQHCRYDFRLPFIEKFLPTMAAYLMQKNQHLLQHSRYLGWLGEGYVIKARKIS